MLWRGIEIEPEWVVLALLLIALAMGRGGQFVKDWTPFLILFLAYEAMRGFAAKTGLAPHDVSGLERALFGGQVPTIWLQEQFYDPSRISIQDWIGMFFYFMHFPLPIVVGFVIWTESRDLYWRFISALLLMCLLAFVTYLVYPTAPPWYSFNGKVWKINDATIAKWGVSYLISPIYRGFNPNQFAAFPSLHAAFPALAAIYAWARHRVLALGLVVWTLCVWLAIVYLGEHYFVDALAGLLYALVAVLIVEATTRRIRTPGSGPARPPTPS
ncbi:MAG TPA: phosphatase PAP2 family protein [Candidatus Dormibacteraeota bacterium]